MMLYLMDNHNKDTINEIVRWEYLASAQNYAQQITVLEVWRVALLCSRTFVVLLVQ